MKKPRPSGRTPLIADSGRPIADDEPAQPPATSEPRHETDADLQRPVPPRHRQGVDELDEAGQRQRSPAWGRRNPARWGDR